MESPRQIKYEYPIIADYINLCYFRSWPGNKMHAHQPRKRSVYEIAKNFVNDLTTVNGGEYLNEPMNQSLAYNQIKNYEDISKKRFSNIDKTVYASGYRSFFDITPDLRFILGKDSKFNNPKLKNKSPNAQSVKLETKNQKQYTSQLKANIILIFIYSYHITYKL